MATSIQAARVIDGKAPADGRLETATLWERVHERLRREILDSRLPPGAELQEVALSQRLGVSRGPIREAIGRLAAEGLVTVRPRRGAVVASLTKDEFLEAYQVREALESFAVRLAVPRLAASELATLQALADEMERLAADDDVDGFFEANARFHQAIVASSGNRQLVEIHRQLTGQMGRYRRVSLRLRGSLRRSVEEHRAILRAVARRDVDRAARLLEEHIRVPQRRLDVLRDERFAALALEREET
jgi:DNA-binding GntR family transcriptional regulator